MESRHRVSASPRRPTAAALGCVVALALALSGCGSGSNYANNPRPPTPIVLGASINNASIAVSPSHFGAGPVVVVVTNQSSAAQMLHLSSAGIGASCAGPGGTRGPVDQTTSPISPQGTAQLQVDLCEGRYTVSVDKGTQSAELVVGPARPSAQNQVLQP
jgi:hypothetical protein